MKRKILYFFAALGIMAVLITACEFGTINNTIGGLKYSVRVDNGRASSASMGSIVLNALRAFTPFKDIGSGDKVELYIRRLTYLEDKNNRGLMIIDDGSHDGGLSGKGGGLNNQGWYSIDEDLAITNTINNGPYSGFQIYITKLRVNGVDEYDFPSSGPYSVQQIFGRPSSVWWGGSSNYPNNFNGINVANSTHSIKTVLTVEPDILGTGAGYTGGIADEPYKYIKVRGILE